MAGLTVRIKADSSNFEKGVKRVKSELGTLTTAVAGVGVAIGSIWAGVKAFQALGDALVDSSKKAAGMEMLQMQFETLTKSSETAKGLIQDFRKEAQKSPLTTQDYAQAAQKMLTVGRSAEEIMPTLRMLGDVSMGNGLKFERLSLAYSQVIAKGRLMGQENNQLAESGFNPLAQISKKTGESMATLMKRMEDGAISSDEVTQAFKDATSAGGLFFQAIQKGAATMEGKLAATRDTIDNLQIAFGEGMNEGVKTGLDAISNGLPQFEGKFREAGKMMGNAITDAVNGDAEKFVAIGTFIGDALSTGIKLALTRGFLEATEAAFKGLEDINPLRMIPGVGGASRVSQTIGAGKEQVYSGQMNDAAEAMRTAIQTLRSQTMTQQGTLGGNFRPAGPGETSPFRDASGRVVMLLEKIAANSEPSKFAN